YLAFRGWSVDAANDYEPAKELLRGRRYAAALVDILITGRRADAGLEFLAFLGDRAPATAMVVLTAYGTEWLEILTRKLGVTHFFAKPKRFDDIADAVVRAVAARPATGEAR